MPRILHTADWQLGLKLRFLSGDRGARARLERFQVLHRLAAAAREHQVDVVVVAGDVFDDNGVGPSTLAATRDALRDFDVPVLLLPGNHDSAGPDAALRRLDAPDHVRVLTTRDRVELPDLHIYPCPLMRRHQQEDPTDALPPRQDGDPVRVALAHGGTRRFSERTETPNLIDADAVIAKGFDYLALGDWHGTYRVSERAWYSGAPEATRFKEKAAGQALVVDLPGPGHAPQVSAIEVSRTRWIQHAIRLGGEHSVAALADWLDALPDASWTLVELTLSGSVSLAERTTLDGLLAQWSERLLHLRVRDAELLELPNDEDLATLPTQGFLGRAVDLLRQGDTPADRDALRLLYRLVIEEAAQP